MAARVSQVPGVDKVRGITRPTGEPLEEAKLSYQAGEVGGKLGDASNLIDARTRDLDKLAAGGHTLADKLGQVRDSVKNSLGTARALVEVLAQLRGSGRTGTLADLDSVDKLVTSMHSLGDAIEANAQGASEVYGWIEPVARVLVGNPACDMDPGCRSSRDEMNKFLETRQDGTRDKIVELGRELKSVDNDKQISSTIARLRTALNSIDTNLRRLGLSDSYGIQKRFTEVLTGVNSLADGSAHLPRACRCWWIRPSRWVGSWAMPRRCWWRPSVMPRPGRCRALHPAAGADSGFLQNSRCRVCFSGRTCGALPGAEQPEPLQPRGDGSGPRHPRGGP